jgi:hypothetical protein
MLLTAQSACGIVRPVAYDESASLVFLAVIATAAGLLVLPPSRRYFLG